MATGGRLEVGTGAMVLTGTGGGTTGSGATFYNNGITVSGGFVTGGAGSTITMTATGGGGTSYNQGVRILSSTVSAGTLDITASASATTTGTYNIGAYVLNSTLSGAGTITATGGGGTGYNHGAYMQGILGTFPDAGVTGTTTDGNATSKDETGNFLTLLPLLMAESDRRARRRSEESLRAKAGKANPFQALADRALALSAPDPAPLAPGDTLVFRDGGHAPFAADGDALDALLGHRLHLVRRAAAPSSSSKAPPPPPRAPTGQRSPRTAPSPPTPSPSPATTTRPSPTSTPPSKIRYLPATSSAPPGNSTSSGKSRQRKI